MRSVLNAGQLGGRQWRRSLTPCPLSLQLQTVSGSLRRSGRQAVVSQTAWIFGGTLRDNILFGAPFEPELYNTVLDVCALRDDLKLMEHGDLSEIGERGLNLR